MIGWASAPYDPLVAAAPPASRGLDGAGRSGGQLYSDASGSGGDSRRHCLGQFAPPDRISGYSALAVSAAGEQTFVTSALSIFFVLNLLLGTFNLLPVPPLDGHAGIMVLMPEKLALRYLEVVHEGSYTMIGLLIAWTAYPYIFAVVFPLGLRLLGHG